MEKIKKIILILILFSVFPFLADAATLYFVPNSGSYNVGGVLPVNIYVSSSDQSINAASGIVNFPKDKLEVVSLSKTGSIFSLWVQEPSFSNILGTINFEGVVFNPGFIGSSGKIITINFRTKIAGTAALNFSSSSVLANDGNGTNVLTNTQTSQFNINTVETKPVETADVSSKVSIPGTPLAPEISSSTHSDSSKWYNSQTANFSWNISDDIIAVKVLLNKVSNSAPTVVYDAINQKEIKDLSDGIWYFHVQLKNSNGWGDISHFRIQIDTKKPDNFSINLIDGKEVETPQPKISFLTTDSLSGIDYYKVKIGEEDVLTVLNEDSKNEIILPIQSPGKKILIVQAFDKAGNYSSAIEEITIKPLETPVIIEYNNELASGDILTIKGKTNYPQSQVNVYFEKDKEIFDIKTVNTDNLGDFLITTENKLKDGIYNVWVEVYNEEGSKSLPSQSVSIVIKKSDFIKVSSKLIEFLSVIIPLALLIILFIFIVSYSHYKLISFRRRLRKEVFEVENIMAEAFDFLKEDLNSQIKLLGKTKTKRELTKEEEKIIKKLKKDIDYLEKSMRKEVEDIKKEIK